MASLPNEIRDRIRNGYRGGAIPCEQLLFLLDSRVSPGAMRARNAFARLLAGADSHRNIEAHTEGSRDKTKHYTVFIDNRGYHLRLDANGVIFQITDPGGRDLGIVQPWVAPGAH